MKLILSLLFIFGTANANKQKADLAARFEKVMKAHPISKKDLGLAVYSLDVGHNGQGQGLIYGLNEERDMIPASLTKIVTAFAVLQNLGPSAKLQTTLWAENEPVNGVLKGDLVLKGGGDSGFVSETMWFLVNEFLRTGVKRIEGNIVVDDSEFDGIRTDKSRDPVRVDRAYDAPVGAMSFNWNSISIFVRPSQAGSPPTVILDPIDNGYKVKNKAKTVAGSASNIQVARRGQNITVTGTIGESATEAVSYKNIDDPVEWSGRNLVFFLGQRGVKVTGKVVSGKRKMSMKMLAKADSKPISLAVLDMMKFSNNYVAEMLAKTLSVHSGKIPGTLEDGMRVIRESIVKIGIPENRFTLINPSGLNRRNQMKPVDLAKVLVEGFNHFPTFSEFVTSFPLSGLDGTLKSRMKEQEGWIRAKTGLLSGVVGLAGYAGRKDGSHRAFVFIFNGKANDGYSARRLFDDLAMELVQL